MRSRLTLNIWFQPRTVADNVNRTVRNRNNNRGRWTWPGSENDITSDENYNLFDRPVTESATAGAGIETDSFSVEHVKCCEIPVTEINNGQSFRHGGTVSNEGVNDNCGTIRTRNKCV